MWLAGKVFLLLVTLWTSGPLSSAQQSPPVQSPPDITSVKQSHVTETDIVTTEQYVHDHKADDVQKERMEKEAGKRDLHLVTTQHEPLHKDLENHIKSSPYTDAMITNPAAPIKAKDTSNAINSMPDIESYSGKEEGGIIKKQDSDQNKSDDSANGKLVINGRLNAVHNKDTMKGSRNIDDTDYKDKSPEGATENHINLRRPTLAGNDVTSAVNTRGDGVTNSAFEHKHDTEAPPPTSFENAMTEHIWTDKAGKVDNNVLSPSITTGSASKEQVAGGSTITQNEDTMSTPSASLTTANSEEHPRPVMPVQDNDSQQKAANDPAVSPMSSFDLGTTLAGPKDTTEDLKAVDDIAKGSGMYGSDTALTVTNKSQPQPNAGEPTAFGPSSNDTNQERMTATDAVTGVTSDAVDEPRTAEFGLDQGGHSKAAGGHSKPTGHLEQVGNSQQVGHSERAGNSSIASYTQAPTKLPDTDYVSIEEAKSLTNDTEADEIPEAVLKVSFAEKSTARPNKDVIESPYSQTSMNYSDIVLPQSLKTNTKENKTALEKEHKDSKMKEHYANSNESSFNVSMQDNDIHNINGDDIMANGTTRRPIYDYGQDYDDYFGEEQDEITNVTIEYQSGFSPESDSKKYDMDINRTKQRARLDASVVTDSNVMQMSKADVTTDHKPLSKIVEKPPAHDVFKSQPHIAAHHKRVYPPHAFHGLIWEDRRYLVSVLVPVGCGVAGALVIVCLAYAARSCQSRRAKKPAPAPQLTPADIAYMDKLMLLADSSDDDV